MEGKPFLHMHVTLADENFQLLGGHLSEAEIGVTGELILEPFDGVLEIKIIQETGLNLLVLGNNYLFLQLNQIQYPGPTADRGRS